MKFTADHYRLLQARYLEHFPEDFPMDMIQDYSSILRFRDYLKNSKPDKQLLTILLDMVLLKIERGQRFQKILLLKLILNHLSCGDIDAVILSKVFRIYQQLIVGEPDEVCWKLSKLIKDRELSSEQVDWLLVNYETSEHILNRILRYPVKNKAISLWAETAINNEELINRRAEIIGLILNFRPKYRHKDHQALAWGIYYSKLTDQEKQELLDRHFYADNLRELLKICEREGFTDLIAKWYNGITEQMDGAKFYAQHGS
jgi:hypothetical protein